MRGEAVYGPLCHVAAHPVRQHKCHFRHLFGGGVFFLVGRADPTFSPHRQSSVEMN